MSSSNSNTALKNRLRKLAVNGLVSSAIFLGYKRGLFHSLAAVSSPDSPATPAEVAQKANCKERYVKEWLAVLATSDIIEINEDEKFWIRPDDIQLLTNNNECSSLSSYIPCYMKAYDKLINVFDMDGPLGLSYSDFNNYHEKMNGESELVHKEHLISVFIPLLSSTLHDELKSGNKMVLDVGCGSGFHMSLLAQEYPASNFTGIDVTPEAIFAANQKRTNEGKTLDNLEFILMDGGKMDDDWTDKYDAVVIFDACHDQVRPDKCLKEIYRVLKPGGVFGMLEIKGTSNIYKDKKKYGDMAALLYSCSMFHCLPVGSNSEDALGLGSMWGSERAVNLLRDSGFNDIQVKEAPEYEVNQIYVCRK